MHKRYAESLAQYKARKDREKLLRESFGHTSAGILQGSLPVLAPGSILPAEVRECKTFIIHGFDQALERYRVEQKAKKAAKEKAEKRRLELERLKAEREKIDPLTCSIK